VAIFLSFPPSALHNSTHSPIHIEEYIRDHSKAEFTRSICQDCAEKLYPEFNFKKTG